MASRNVQTRVYEFGCFRLEIENRLLFCRGEQVSLQPKTFDLLLLLVERRGRVLTKDALMEEVWPDAVVEESNLTQNVYIIRKILGADPDGNKYIETVPKRGYRFVANVVELKEDMEGRVIPFRGLASAPAPGDTESGPAAPESLQQQIGPHISTPVTSPDAPAALTKPVPMSIFNPFRGARAHPLSAAVLVLIAAIVTLYLIGHRQSSPKRMRSVAVLPFKPVNADTDEESLGLGLAEDLVTRLSSTKQIIVTPTVAASRFAGKNLGPAEIGRSLGVDAVLIGTVQRAEDRIRFNAQLLRTDDQTPLWADKFDERSADILTVQDRLSERLVLALALELNGDQERLLTKKYTKDAEAFQLYMNAYGFWKKRSRDGFNVSADYLQQALRIDPQYALAWAGLAGTYSSQSQLGFVPPNKAMPLAEAAARRALEIDDTLPTAHAALAMIKAFYNWDLPAAETEFQKAIDLDSNFLEAHQYYALCLAAMGRFADCRDQLQVARQLDPFSPNLDSTATYALYLEGKYDEVIALCRQAIEVNPNFYFLHLHLGHALAAKGMYDPAISAFQKARIASGNASLVLARLGYAYGAAGRKREARQVLAELQETSAQPHYIAQVYMGLNEPDSAIQWLHKAQLERSGDLIFLKTDPIYKVVESDPKFTDLLQHISLSSRPTPTMTPN